MKKILAIFLSVLMACSMFVTCFSFSVSAAPANIASGKSYTVTGLLKDGSGKVTYPDESGKDLTNGIKGSTAAECIYTNSLWVGFGSGNATIVDYIVVDLESVQSGLKSFSLFAQNGGSGVGKPAFVEIMISNDNTTFTRIGSDYGTRVVDASDPAKPETADYGIYEYKLALDKTVSARYVKFAVTHSKNLAMYSEVEIYQDLEAPVAPALAMNIDGKLDDANWSADQWVNVNNLNSNAGISLKDGEVRKENFDYQFKADDNYLYVGVKFNSKPVSSDTFYGNGQGTNFRIWTYVDGSKDANGTEYITYNNIFNYAYRPSGSALTLLKNSAPLGNTGVGTANKTVVASTAGSNYWYIEMAIPLAEIGSTEAAHFYLTMNSPLTNSGSAQTGNLAWNYPNYGPGMESNGNADAPYVEWNKDTDLDIKFADIKIGLLPATAQKIDDFGNYANGITTVLTRINGKTTLGEISAITMGSAKDYNFFYLVAVDSNNRVTEINQKLGRKKAGETEIVGEKDAFVVPEGGYVLLCNGNASTTHTQAMIDEFKTIKVGDFIALYNVDLKALATGAALTTLTNAGFTVSKKVEYAAGVTMEADAAKVTTTKALNVLSDGKTALVDSSKNHDDEQVVLFKNLVCKEKDVFPVVDLILNLGAAVKFDTVNLSFYHNYTYMIGLPKDNKITISYANDPASFTELGEYTFEGAAASGTSGVLPANLALGKTIFAQYVKISFAFGKAPWETEGKTNWEFIGMTEFGVSSTNPAAGYTNLSNAEQVTANKAFTVLGDGKTALADEKKEHNDAQVVLFQNKVCKEAGVFPKVELVLAYAAPKTIDTIKFGFYHDYDVMIGLPKDNKVLISYSNDPAEGYTPLQNFIIEGTPEPDKNEVIAVDHKLNTAIKARFIKISFEFGKAPWETDGKTNWEFIALTEFSAYGYAEGVVPTYTNVALHPATSRSLRTLIDGKTAESVTTFNNGEVLLFKNSQAADASKAAKAELIFSLSQAQAIDTVKLYFYHEYISMIGLPKDNKVTLEYANNYADFTKLGDFTVNGKAESGKSGVVETVISLDSAVSAKYVKLTFEYGPSPFAEQNKPVWEFIGLTEVSFEDNSQGLETSEINPSDTDVIVSKDKTYTSTKAERTNWTDTDPATKLTDGDLGSLDKLGGAGPWVGFQLQKIVPYTYTSDAWVAGETTFNPDERDVNGKYYAIIDLGQNVQSIYKYSVRFGQIVNYGILFPSKVEFYASVDGTKFYKIGEGEKGTVENNGAATLKEWVDYTYSSTQGVTARYIKVAITPEEAVVTAPTAAGTEGQVNEAKKTVVTGLTEISVIAKTSAELPVYSDTPVNKDGYAVDHVTTGNTTYPNGHDKYTASLTDNVAATVGSYDNKWYAFNYNAGFNTVNGVGQIKVDLGENKNIGGFRVNIWQPSESGIGVPEITVYGSINDKDWLEIGKLVNPTEKVGWASLVLDYELPVRYIRFDVKLVGSGVFAMLNEIEVLSYESLVTFSADFANQYTVGYTSPDATTGLGGVGEAVYLFTPNKGATLGEAANTGISWWDVWVVDYDTTNKNYYIKAFYPSSSQSKGNVEIPQYGFIIAAHGKGMSSINNALRAQAAIGAKVYVYDMNVQTLEAQSTKDFVNTNTISVFAPIEGKTAFEPEIKQEQTDPFELKDPNNTSIQIKDGKIFGITDKMTIDEIKALFVGEVTITKKGTGATITAGDQSIVMVILGDLDGDGVIDATDYMLLKKAILGNVDLSEVEQLAALISGNTTPDATDYMLVKKHVLGNYNIFTQQ
jgi:hypothetical protein